jgi:hypothetical protein
MILILFSAIFSAFVNMSHERWVEKCSNFSIVLCQVNMDTIPKQKNKTKSFPDEMSQDNFLKAEVSRSDSSIRVKGDIKKDYRIFGYERPNKKSRPLILFSVFTRDVQSNPYRCRYGAYYSTSDLAFEETKIKFKGFNGQFLRADLLIEGEVIDTFYFERQWITFIK